MTDLDRENKALAEKTIDSMLADPRTRAFKLKEAVDVMVGAGTKRPEAYRHIRAEIEARGLKSKVVATATYYGRTDAEINQRAHAGTTVRVDVDPKLWLAAEKAARKKFPGCQHALNRALIPLLTGRAPELPAGSTERRIYMPTGAREALYRALLTEHVSYALLLIAAGPAEPTA